MPHLVRSSKCDEQCVSRDKRTHPCIHVLASFVQYTLLANILVVLHVTARPKFETWLASVSRDRRTKPQHPYRCVPENVKHMIVHSLFVVTCEVISSSCVSALYEFSAELSGYHDSTHRVRWFQHPRTHLSQKNLIWLCPLLLWRVRSNLSSELGPVLSENRLYLWFKFSRSQLFDLWLKKKTRNLSSCQWC